MGGAHSWTSPRLPWEGKSSTSMLTRSRARRGAACRPGVRSPTGALGSPQSGTGLGDGEWEALQEDRSEADRPRVPFVCTYVRAHATCTVNSDVYLYTRVGRKRRVSCLLRRNFCLCLPLFRWHQRLCLGDKQVPQFPVKFLNGDIFVISGTEAGVGTPAAQVHVLSLDKRDVSHSQPASGLEAPEEMSFSEATYRHKAAPTPGRHLANSRKCRHSTGTVSLRAGGSH